MPAYGRSYPTTDRLHANSQRIVLTYPKRMQSRGTARGEGSWTLPRGSRNLLSSRARDLLQREPLGPVGISEPSAGTPKYESNQNSLGEEELAEAPAALQTGRAPSTRKKSTGCSDLYTKQKAEGSKVPTCGVRRVAALGPAVMVLDR